MRYPHFIEADFRFPAFWHLRMEDGIAGLAAPASAAVETIDRVLAAVPVRDGDTVAVAVGSRGIANLPQLVGALCQRLQLQACFTTLGPKPLEEIRAVVVRDTRHVREFLATAALGEGLLDRGDVEVLSRDALRFDEGGDLRPPWERIF